MVRAIYDIYLLNNNILIVVLLYITVDAALEQNKLKKHLIKKKAMRGKKVCTIKIL